MNTHLLKKIRKLDPRKIVIGRCSCIGKAVLEVVEKPHSYQFINQQKTRLDHFRLLKEGATTPQPETIKKFVPRSDIYSLIAEQQTLPWEQSHKKIEYGILDTFCELTDKKFTHKNDGWSFCCHYSDINHVPEFDDQFLCEGLLPDDEISSSYKWFFDWFNKVYPGKNLYVILVPTSLDTRELYKKRAELIEEIVSKLAITYTFVKILKVSNDQVSHSQDDDFPYHFSQETYFAFSKKWNIITDIEQIGK